MASGEAPEGGAGLRAGLSRIIDAARAGQGVLALAGTDPDLLALAAMLDQRRAVAGGAPAARPVAPPSEPAPALDASRQREAVLKYIIANLPHRIFWKDREGRFLGANENLLRDLGFPSEAEIIGRTDFDLPFPRAQAEFYRGVDRQVMESGQPMLDIEEPQDRPDGVHLLQTSKVPLRDERGEVSGILGIFVDITERKKLEDALKHARDEAEAAARAKSRFLTAMSHELRTPLTLILGPLESLLEGTELPDRIRTDLERVRRSARRLHREVDDLLDLSRLEAGEMAVSSEPVDVAALVAEIVDDARPTAAQRRIELRFAGGLSDSGASVDRRKLEKIVLNLLNNALKFTPEDGEIEVTLTEVAAFGANGASGFELAVRDSGPGIPADQHGLLFRRFQQLDGSVARRQEGSGIGLALVREFATLMGGEAGVESTPGKGSRFHVRLPLRVLGEPPGLASEPSMQVAPASRPAWRPPSLRRLPTVAGSAETRPATSASLPRLLIVDDNDELRAYLADLLSGEYRVEAVGDGRAALEAAKRERPEAILSDVMMPRMDGLELLSWLRGNPDLRSVPVILLTAKAGSEEVVKGLDAGADDYLVKPFGVAELRARVAAARRVHRLYLDLEREHGALKETQAQLLQAGKMAALGSLVGGLAHELNNPLGIVLMHAQSALARQGDSEAATRALRAIEQQAQRCGKLILGLLDFVRKRPPTRQPTVPCQMVASVAQLTAAHARRHGVVLVIEPSPDELPGILVGPQEIELVLVNLLSNAIEASAAGARVTIRMRALARGSVGGVEFEVVDSGCGIAPEALPRIFEPFYSSKPPGQGTGLGLALAHGVAEAHGGAISVESTLGRGTTMRLWLPERPPGEEAGAPALPSARPSNAGAGAV